MQSKKTLHPGALDPDSPELSEATRDYYTAGVCVGTLDTYTHTQIETVLFRKI